LNFAPCVGHIPRTLRELGNQTRAAQSLGLTLRQFSYRLRKAGLR
jgi:Nif-specific regulatory protein